MSDRIEVESEGHALTIGRYWIDRNPLKVLKHLQAQIGYWGGRTVIVLSEADKKALDECVAFNEGRG